MSRKCFLGFHTWNGCSCKVCGTHRDKNHAWKGCKCTICGKERHEWVEEDEEWSDDEAFEANGGGLENMWMLHQHRSVWRCAKCGKIRRDPV